MTITCCCWCNTLIKVSKKFNQKKHIASCSVGCTDAEILFNLWMSDEEINRRAHYRYLTTGEDSE